jgi:hypothetical protein
MPGTSSSSSSPGFTAFLPALGCYPASACRQDELRGHCERCRSPHNSYYPSPPAAQHPKPRSKSQDIPAAKSPPSPPEPCRAILSIVSSSISAGAPPPFFHLTPSGRSRTATPRPNHSPHASHSTQARSLREILPRRAKTAAHSHQRPRRWPSPIARFPASLPVALSLPPTPAARPNVDPAERAHAPAFHTAPFTRSAAPGTAARARATRVRGRAASVCDRGRRRIL